MRSWKNGIAFSSCCLAMYVVALLNRASAMSCFSSMSCCAIFSASSFLLDLTACVMAVGLRAGDSGVVGC